MKNPRITWYLLAAMVGVAIADRAFADDPILETYRIAHGGSDGADSRGLRALVQDSRLGSGRAETRIEFSTRAEADRLRLKVFRRAKGNRSVPALRVTQTLISGLDAAGTQIYAKNAGNFVFGSGQSGSWTRTIRDIPTGIREIRITYYGNYE